MITLTREEAQQVLDAWDDYWVNDEQRTALEMLRARLAQPERQWHGLTDGEIDAYFRAIEAKLKEKNT